MEQCYLHSEDVPRQCYLDFQGAGYITTEVLKQILHEIDDTLTNEDLDGMINEIDEDGSGTVDFDGEPLEFIIMQF